MSIAMALLLGIFIIFPLKERVTNAKQVPILAIMQFANNCIDLHDVKHVLTMSKGPGRALDISVLVKESF